MKPTTAVEMHIPLNLLIEWEHNPRKTRHESDVFQMAASTASIGQQAPLIVFASPGEKLYKVIEGETRRRAFNMNASNGVITANTEIRCWALPEGTPDDQLMAIAVAANTVRRQMNAIEEMEAFHSLAMSGLKLSTIAEMFAVEVRIIRQRLALGSLVESARNIVRENKRQMGWAQAMTLGSPAAQERIVGEIMANPSAYPDGASVKAEITRGHIPVASALFKPSELANCLVCDLFSQHGDHFSDTAAFWARQNKEIQKLINELQTTHANVKFVDRTRFDDAGWTTGGEEAESTAVVIAHDDGSVEIRKGMIPPVNVADDNDDDEGNFLVDADEHYGREHELSTDSKSPAATNTANDPADDHDGNGSQPAPIAQIAVNPLDNATKDTLCYLTAQIGASLKLAVASDARMSMAFVIASTLTRRGPTSAMHIVGFTIDQRDQTAPVFNQLQNKRAARDRIVTEAGIAGVTSPAAVIAKLLGLKDGLLEQLFAYTVADSIAVGIDEPTVNIFDAVGADMMAGWTIEENYLKTLNNAQIRALALEVIDPSAQPSPRAARGVIEKAIIESVNANALAGNFMSDEASWIPPQIAVVLNQAALKRDAIARQDPIAQAA